jgi:hypothetical protein
LASKSMVVQEKDILHVLHKRDGSVLAELMMTPTEAAKINARRRAQGFRGGDWKPQKIKQYGLKRLDTADIVGKIFSMTKDEVKVYNKALPKTMGLVWAEVKGDSNVQDTQKISC